MKKIKIRELLTKSLSLLMCCMLVVGAAGIGTIKAHAAESSGVIAKVGDTEYESYQAAWDAVKEGGTITMLGNWTIDGVLTVNKNTSVTVNMNGFMINRNLTSGKNSGEIFLVQNNASLVLDGNDVETTTHWGTLSKDNWYYQGEGKGNYPINGALLTGGHNKNGGGAIHIQENASVKIDGVSVAGNVCSDDEKGGAIRLQGKNAKLEVVDSLIAYNKSEKGGGGAIWVEGVDSQTTIKNSRIYKNTVTIDYGDGGAIQINNGRVTLENCELSFNEAGRDGGAVYISNGNLFADQDTVFLRNVANKEGGALYVGGGADKVNIKGSFVGNYAEEEGGAIYVNGKISGEKGLVISDAEMMGNHSKGNGGAVYVDPDDSISLSGKVVIHGNSPNNLYIKSSDNIAKNELTDGSKIGIYTSWDANSKSPVKTSNYGYFFSDKIGYEITGNDGSFHYTKSAETDLTSYNAGGEVYPLLKRTFSYTGMEGGTMSPFFYYSDGYFAEDPKFYNEHLSSLSVSMALAAMTTKHEGDYTEAKASKNIVDMFVSMGFENIFVHYPEPEFYGKDAENLSTIGYAIAKKTVTLGGQQTTIVATAVRGGGYGAEWASNVTLGSGTGEAEGFGDAARQVKQGIDAYLINEGISGENAKFFITGYSRAAATSNLVAKKLTDTYGEEKVYAYCFETPKGGVPSELQEGLLYTNIHNIINRGDVVTTVGTTEMGFIRYGIDHIVPGHIVGSGAYKEQKKLMLAQLGAINPNISHQDTFTEATIEYFWSTVDFLDKVGLNNVTTLVDPNWFPEFKKSEDWIPFFIEKLQAYALNDMLTDVNLSEEQMLKESYQNYTKDNIYNRSSTKWYGYRNFWADYEWCLQFDPQTNMVKNTCYARVPADFNNDKYILMSVEDSVAYLMDFYFGSSKERKEALSSALDVKSLMSKISAYKVWDDLVGEWDNKSIGERNNEFADLWNKLGFEEAFKDLFNPDEFKMLKASIYVVFDFLLDFVADDYDETDQDILGTLLFNIDKIMQTHYQDVTCAWVRSYDSFYSDIEFVCKHTYGETVVLQEATEDQYGIQKKVCTICSEEAYEAVPMLGDPDNAGSLIGSGNVWFIAMGIVIIVVAAAVTIEVMRRKKHAA